MIFPENLELNNTTQVRVRYADTDKMGIVYNGNYLMYFEIGRTELMRSYGLAYTELEKAGFLLPLVESHVNYIESAYYDDILNIESTLKPEYKATLRFNYQITRGKSLITQGYTIHTFVNKDTRKPVRPPEIFIKALNKINTLI